MVNVLSEHHEHLERAFEALVTRARRGHWGELRAEWTTFERELLEHLTMEEKEILPAFAREQPEDVRTLRLEHDRIRAALAELGVALDLHLIQSPVIEALAVCLDEHSRRENRMLYPWAEQHLPHARWDATERGLGWAGRERPKGRVRTPVR